MGNQKQSPIVSFQPSSTIQTLPTQTQISFPISTPSIIEIPSFPVKPFLEVAQASRLCRLTSDQRQATSDPFTQSHRDIRVNSHIIFFYLCALCPLCEPFYSDQYPLTMRSIPAFQSTGFLPPFPRTIDRRQSPFSFLYQRPETSDKRPVLSPSNP
jgi:hypothetical protein